MGFSHIVAVNNEHVVYSWGENGHGQLGHGDTKSRGTPDLIEALKGRSILRLSVRVEGRDDGGRERDEALK